MNPLNTSEEGMSLQPSFHRHTSVFTFKTTFGHSKDP